MREVGDGAGQGTAIAVAACRTGAAGLWEGLTVSLGRSRGKLMPPGKAQTFPRCSLRDLRSEGLKPGRSREKGKGIREMVLGSARGSNLPWGFLWLH